MQEFPVTNGFLPKMLNYELRYKATIFFPQCTRIQVAKCFQRMFQFRPHLKVQRGVALGTRIGVFR